MFRVEATIAVSFWTTPKTDQSMALREVADIASCTVHHKRKMTLNGRIALYNYLNIRGFSWILPSNLFDVYQVMQCTKRSARPHMSQSCLCGNWLQAHHLDNPTVSAWMGLAHGTSCAKGDPAWSDGPTELRTETVTSARTGAALTADNIWSRLVLPSLLRPLPLVVPHHERWKSLAERSHLLVAAFPISWRKTKENWQPQIASKSKPRSVTPVKKFRLNQLGFEQFCWT